MCGLRPRPSNSMTVHWISHTKSWQANQGKGVLVARIRKFDVNEVHVSMVAIPFKKWKTYGALAKRLQEIDTNSCSKTLATTLWRIRQDDMIIWHSHAIKPVHRWEQGMESLVCQRTRQPHEVPQHVRQSPCQGEVVLHHKRWQMLAHGSWRRATDMPVWQ